MATTEGDDPVIAHPTWLNDVRHFFTRRDVGCMRPRGIDLSSYDAVKEHSTNIYLQTQAGNMPAGGPPWSANRVQSFLNWMTDKFPMGTSAPKAASALAAPAAAAPRLRKNINSLTPAELDRLATAFRGIMALDPKNPGDPVNPNSYYGVAALHGEPLLYCMHHVQPFTAWHRLYMTQFEDALRSVPGCEDVTLPYWDFTTLAPDFLYQPPFDSYTVPVPLNGYDSPYTTQRNSAQQIYDNYQVAPAVATSVAESLEQALFGSYKIIGADYYIVQGHDNAHNEGGPTLQDPMVASYDPIFWFFHCNWDRVWLSWQTIAGATTVEGFTSTLGSDTAWLQLPLEPWTQSSADTISYPEVAYDVLAGGVAETGGEEAMLKAKSGSIEAHRSFAVPASPRVSVRVKDINRLAIPGTFVVRLLADGEQVARQAFFQPPVPKDCPTCGALPLVSVDFHVDHSALAGKTLSIAIDVPSLGEGDMGRFPLSQAGNPTINARLLLEES